MMIYSSVNAVSKFLVLNKKLLYSSLRFADPNCEDAFRIDSQCYKVHKNERVPWFTALNRCRSNNGSLAVFNDRITQYFPSTLLSEQAWIGLLRSRWTWTGLISDICYVIKKLVLHLTKEIFRLVMEACIVTHSHSSPSFKLAVFFTDVDHACPLLRMEQHQSNCKVV